MGIYGYRSNKKGIPTGTNIYYLELIQLNLILVLYVPGTSTSTYLTSKVYNSYL
eukprot:SAG31_NODE_8334_length_1473_cov_2.002185_1_plen_54_part_00